MGRTITVRGEGGAEYDLDVPDGGVQRELFEDMVRKGRMFVLGADGSPLPVDADGPVPGTDEYDQAQAPEPEPTPELEDDERVEAELLPPPASALKPEWIAYAISQGADPQDAEAASKADLVETYGGAA